MSTSLIELPPNQIDRFYRGGARIANFRGLPAVRDHAPEDWVGSTTTVFGDPSGTGSSYLENGRLFSDVLRQEGMPDGADVLVKLLDAGERLPVHAHPDAAFAASHLGLKSGKTEAWVILEAEAGAVVHVGFSRTIRPDELRAWSDSQDVSAMLAAMNKVEVRQGDTVFVPAGTLHAIGAGILLVELQEPSDLSILLEWKDIVSERDAYLGLPRDVAFEAFDIERLQPERLDLVRSSRGDRLFPEESEAYFRGAWKRGDDRIDQGFSLLVACEGEGAVTTAEGEEVALRRGSTVAVLPSAGETRLRGEVTVLRCQGPAPTAAV